MIRILPFALLAAPVPALADPLCVPTAIVPGFAAGQAPLVDKLGINRPMEVALKPVDDQRFPVPLTRHQPAGSMGGVFPLEVRAAGTYRLLLSDHAWADLVQNGAAVPSADHQHGAPCSGVAKILSFRLEPGHYQLQLSEADKRAITVKIAPEALIAVNAPGLIHPMDAKPR